MRYLLLIFTFLSVQNSWAANDFLDSLNKKAEVKKGTSWTLAGWLATKNKVALMDSWLAVNSSASIFEFYGGVSHYNFEDLVTSDFNAAPLKDELSTVTAAGFLSILGIKFEQEIDDLVASTTVEGSLRLLGKAEQATHLNLFYGIKIVEDSDIGDAFDIQYYGGELRLYLLSFLSVQGNYKKIFESERSDQLLYSGNQVEYGAAIDVGALQFFGKMVTTKNILSSGTESQRSGFRYGVYLYF